MCGLLLLYCMPMLGEGIVAIQVWEEESIEGSGVPRLSKSQWSPKIHLFHGTLVGEGQWQQFLGQVVAKYHYRLFEGEKSAKTRDA